MTDIVERLKAWASLVASGYEVPSASKAMHEAAAEIERLRDDLDGTVRLSCANTDRALVAEARLAEAVEMVRDVTPSLIAAISLLERGGKRAAASDKMFAQMLKDYSASVARARAFLAKLKGLPEEKS